MNLIEELKWRGMIQDIMPGTEEQLAKEMTSGYIGFDPTSDSLHIGSLVPILLLVHLQKAGHKPFALVGGATGMVGDPSGKSEERNLLSEEVLNHNLAGVKKQLEKFLNFDPSLPNKAEMVNNYDWFRDMSFLDFIRDVGKHITVNYMSAKDSVKKRLEGENGMSFTEFTYQLVQGYDFYWLYKNKGCKLQMGGSDQWGNITTGTELIRRKAGGEAFAFTCPLLTKADGGKFGKTEKGNVWLDPEKTSPYLFYQFWLNASDTDAEKWIKIFTFLSPDEVTQLQLQHNAAPEARLLQKTLAQEITTFVHGKNEFEQARKTTENLFSNRSASPKSMTIEDIKQLQGITEFLVSKGSFDQGLDIVTLLAESGSFSSKGEARKTIQQGGVSMNGIKIDNPTTQVTSADLLSDNYILIQKGKKNFSLLKTINVLEEFGTNGRNLADYTSKTGNPTITQATSGQLGMFFNITGIWNEEEFTWNVRDGANKSSNFIFTYLSDLRFTFYLNVLVSRDDQSISKHKWIRFEPSFAKTEIYDPLNEPHEMAYVNEVVRENAFDRSIIDIRTAVLETFGQGGWIYNKVHSFRIRGQGKVRKVIFGNFNTKPI